MRTKFRKPDLDKIYVYGRHAVLSVLSANSRPVEAVFVSEKNRQFFLDFLAENKIESLLEKTTFTTLGKLDNMFPNSSNHQGFVLVVGFRKPLSFDEFFEKLKRGMGPASPKILALDQVTDAHNVGAIIRSAVAFGVSHLLVGRHNSPKDSGTIVKTSAGLSEHIQILEAVNLGSALGELKSIGYGVVGFDGRAEENLDDFKESENLIIVMGSEDRGMRPSVKAHCDHLLRIPMANNVESLNVSVAAGIALYSIWGSI